MPCTGSNTLHACVLQSDTSAQPLHKHAAMHVSPSPKAVMAHATHWKLRVVEAVPSITGTTTQQSCCKACCAANTRAVQCTSLRMSETLQAVAAAAHTCFDGVPSLPQRLQILCAVQQPLYQWFLPQATTQHMSPVTTAQNMEPKDTAWCMSAVLTMAIQSYTCRRWLVMTPVIHVHKCTRAMVTITFKNNLKSFTLCTLVTDYPLGSS